MARRNHYSFAKRQKELKKKDKAQKKLERKLAKKNQSTDFEVSPYYESSDAPTDDAGDLAADDDSDVDEPLRDEDDT